VAYAFIRMCATLFGPAEAVDRRSDAMILGE
jgi:hypothetical protein